MRNAFADMRGPGDPNASTAISIASSSAASSVSSRHTRKPRLEDASVRSEAEGRSAKLTLLALLGLLILMKALLNAQNQMQVQSGSAVSLAQRGSQEQSMGHRVQAVLSGLVGQRCPVAVPVPDPLDA